MGTKVIFHGLEQASAMMDDTWFMYVGASERNNLWDSLLPFLLHFS